jgi:hydroxyacylglutathione hydrolase
MNLNSQNLEIVRFTLGPIENNTYLISDPASQEAVVIDPTFDIRPVLELTRGQQLSITQILLTHAHFDHIAGVNELMSTLSEKPKIGLHPADLPLWKDRGEAQAYGIQMDPLPAPDHFFIDRELLTIGTFHIDVRHTPGHSPGHVVFYIPDKQAILCGDILFAGSIGRTDIAGGNHIQLLNSIREKILCFPDDTRLLPGHGPETTVGFERCHNPYLK